MPDSRTVDELDREAVRLVTWLRGLTASRWAAVLPTGGSVADAVHGLAAVLGRLAGAPVPVPRLPDLALPDVVAVLAGDLVDALRSADDEAAAAETAATALVELRRVRAALRPS